MRQCCSQSQHLSTVIAWQCQQAAGSRRRDGELDLPAQAPRGAFQAPRGACATERAPELCPFSKIIMPHRSATYLDATYCYRPSSVVCRSVCLSVGLSCRSVTLLSPAKTAEPIEMPFGLWTQVVPRNHVLDGFQIPP